MRTTAFAALLLLVAGCSGSTADDGSTNSNELERKREAAEAAADGSSAGDACAENAWYGDGVCDSFCAQADTDCVPPDPGDDPVVCALFLEESDAVCSRPADDPCRYQDPDCSEPPAGTDPDDPVACAAISEIPDGVCSRPETDPCRSQDPDCVDSGGGTPPGGYNCDLSNVSCEIVEPTCADGEVPTASGYCYGPCVPKDQCAPQGVACAAYIEESDGVCSRPETDPCRSQDPDCVGGGSDPGDDDVACAEYIEESDGECSRPASDPCKFQDPDCG